MSDARTRRLPDGRILAVHRNRGLRKICDCARSKWAKCVHPWHFSFKWLGKDHRGSLDRYMGQHIDSKTEAEASADRIRAEIRAGTFGGFKAGSGVPANAKPQPEQLSFASYAKVWDEGRGYQLARPRDNRYRIGVISSFVLPGTNPLLTFGMKAVSAVVPADIEAFRHARKKQGLSAVTVNHDLKLLRKMFNWGVRNGYLDRSPFKIGGEPAIPLERETPRDRRFQDGAEEQRLLDAANPHLRGVIIAMLDTCCRPGEVLSLQWRDVDLEAREISITAAKAKTRVGRFAPISARLLAALEMRQLDPSGQSFGPDAYVFGNEVGERVTSVRTAWENACKRAGLQGFHLADLRHEAASCFEEAGIPISHVSRILGHASLSTTTRYLNSSHRWLRLAVEKLDNARKGDRTEEGHEEEAGTDVPASVASSLQDPTGTLASAKPH